MAYGSEGLENLFASLYRWSAENPPCQDQEINFSFPLPKLYEYAAFFFSTIEGKSYLFRRESRLRTLVEYYSLLIVDRAEQAGLNRYHIDLPENIAQVEKDINESDYLIFKKQYTNSLYSLHDRAKQ